MVDLKKKKTAEGASISLGGGGCHRKGEGESPPQTSELLSPRWFGFPSGVGGKADELAGGGPTEALLVARGILLQTLFALNS